MASLNLLWCHLKGTKQWEMCASVFWTYFTFSVLMGRCCRSVNSPSFLLSWAFFNLLWCCLKGQNKREMLVSAFLRYSIIPLQTLKTVSSIFLSFFLIFSDFWIFLCRFFLLNIHLNSENNTLYCHQQSSPSLFFPRFLPIWLVFFIYKVVISIFGRMP